MMTKAAVPHTFPCWLREYCNVADGSKVRRTEKNGEGYAGEKLRSKAWMLLARQIEHFQISRDNFQH